MYLTRHTLWLLVIGCIATLVAGVAYLVPGSWLSDTELGMAVGVAAGAFLAALLHWFMPAFEHTATPALRRRYYREMALPLLAYVLVMLSWKRVLGHVDALWLRAVVAVLPVLLVALLMRVFVRYVRDLDELQRRSELEAIAFATLAVGLGYMGAAFLQLAGVIAISATTAMLWVFPFHGLAYGLFRTLILRRYQ